MFDFRPYSHDTTKRGAGGVHLYLFRVQMLSAEYKMPRAAAHRAAHLPSTQVHGRTAEGKDLTQRKKQGAKTQRLWCKRNGVYGLFSSSPCKVIRPFCLQSEIEN